MKSSLLLVLLSLPFASILGAGPAHAGCDPECNPKSACRYEAAGNKFYCPKKKDGKFKGAPGKPGAENSPAYGDGKAYGLSGAEAHGKVKVYKKAEDEPEDDDDWWYAPEPPVWYGRK